jgi:ABC-type branched-subunit amino acid transport system substrate-binding protein
VHSVNPDDERDFIERQHSDLSRRLFLEWLAKAGFSSFGIAMLSGGILEACSSGGGGGSNPPIAQGPCDQPLKGSNDVLKFGVVGIFSGPGAFIGRITDASLNTARDQINKTGGVGGRKIDWIRKDAGIDPTAAVKIYNDFASSPDVAGVLWTTIFGLDESLEQIKKDSTPVMNVFWDLFSEDKLYTGPGSTGARPVFQFIQPDLWAHEVGLRYAKEDRGYQTVALLYDNFVDDRQKTYHEKAVAKVGIKNVGIETYKLLDTEYGQQLQRLKAAKPHCVQTWGLSQNSAGIVQELERLGAQYIDRDAALGPDWHPHILGAPGGTGEHTWADLSNGAAKTGSVTVWHVGGLVALPQFAIRFWLKESGAKPFPTGGEEVPADALYTLTKAITDAQCLDRQAIVTAIEKGGPRKFASLEFDFSETNHLSQTMDDLVIIVLENKATPASTDPPYVLGREFQEVFPPGYTGPVALVRPTLEVNKRRFPDVVKVALEQGWGTQCTKRPPTKLGDDVVLSKECKIH